MIRFEWLSFDVQLTILNFLEPLDILRLRKTCKTLHRTTSERVVWTNALRRACVRNSIFMPTFPIHDMSQSALEYAAAGPDRFLRTVANGNLPKPRSHCIIQRRYEQFQEIFVVPGGRYLVTVDNTIVAVWDLGIPGSSMAARCSEPIGTMPTHPYFALLLVHPTDDGHGLTIFIEYETVHRVFFQVFRIYPSDKLPSLKQIGQLDIPCLLDALPFCSLSRNKIIYLFGSTLNVWEYEADAWASISVPNHYKRIIVAESFILVLYLDVVLIWNMPPLSTNKPLFSGSPPSNIPPTIILKIPNTQTPTAGYCRGHCNWYCGSPHPLLFDFASAVGFQRFEIVHKNENFTDSIVTTLGTYRDSNGYFMKDGRFCNDTFVRWWTVMGETYRASRLWLVITPPVPSIPPSRFSVCTTAGLRIFLLAFVLFRVGSHTLRRIACKL